MTEQQQPYYQPPPPPPPPPPPQGTKKNLTPKQLGIGIVVGIIIIFIIVVAAASSGSDKKEEKATPSTSTSTSKPSDSSTPKSSSGTTTTPAPTPVPASIPYSGSGDSVISISQPEPGPLMLFISGNSGGRHFAVEGYDSYGLETELFVNTTDPYQGYTMDPAGETVQLEISATGGWAIESCSVRSARAITAPGTITGSGDEVLQVSGSASTATITGNAGGRHFAVIAWNPSSNLLVNTTDVYQGTVRFPSKTTVLSITAVGDWSITLQ